MALAIYAPIVVFNVAKTRSDAFLKYQSVKVTTLALKESLNSLFMPSTNTNAIETKSETPKLRPLLLIVGHRHPTEDIVLGRTPSCRSRKHRR
jgi:hypothetical protein